MAPGGAGLRGTPDDWADDDLALPLSPPCEQPVTPDKPAKLATTTATPHSRGR